jgi:hypothetical protein
MSIGKLRVMSYDSDQYMRVIGMAIYANLLILMFERASNMAATVRAKKHGVILLRDFDLAY